MSAHPVQEAAFMTDTSDNVINNITNLAAEIPNGAKLAVFKDNVPMALARALIRKNSKNLHMIGVPTSGLFADMLIGAGCVKTMESSGVTMSEYGQAPCFVRAVQSGAIQLLDSTCPAVYTGLQAAEKGIPFMPIRGLLGSDILANRPDYKIIDNPYAVADPIVAIPALQPDVAVFHVPLADRHGNVWTGGQHELKLMAHAARATLVTCERLYDGNLLADAQLAAATISAFYITAISIVEHGCWPLALPGYYPADEAAIRVYMHSAQNAAGMRNWLDEHVCESESVVG